MVPPTNERTEELQRSRHRTITIKVLILLSFVGLLLLVLSIFVQ